MIRFIVNRLLQSIPTILLVSIAVFLMLHLTPGDPAEIFIGDRQSTPEQLEVVREQMGLNRPLHVQYLDYMWNVLQGDLGNSLNNGRPVLDEILLRLPHTLELTLAAMLISTILGIGLGIIAALNQMHWGWNASIDAKDMRQIGLDPDDPASADRRHHRRPARRSWSYHCSNGRLQSRLRVRPPSRDEGEQ